MKLCTKFERNRAIRGGVIALSICELMTSCYVLRWALGYFLQSLTFDNLSVPEL